MRNVSSDFSFNESSLSEKIGTVFDDILDNKPSHISAEQNMPLRPTLNAAGRHAKSSKRSISTTAPYFNRYFDVPVTFQPLPRKPAFQVNNNKQFPDHQTIDTLHHPAFGWYGNTTHPEDHNPYAYRYLIHSYNPPPKKKMEELIPAFPQMPALNKSLNMKRDYDKAKWASFETPEKLGNRLSLSASLVDQDNRNTYGSAGYILETTNSNIIAARESDLWVNNWNRDALDEISGEGRLNADEILQRTPIDTYNEVLIGGNAMEIGLIRVTGTFYKVGNQGQPINPQLAEHFQKLAKQHGLKAIALPQ